MKFWDGLSDELGHLRKSLVFHAGLADGEVGDVSPALEFPFGEQPARHHPHTVEMIGGKFSVGDKPIDVNAAEFDIVSVFVSKRF